MFRRFLSLLTLVALALSLPALGQGIFVTPVPGAPFTGAVSVERSRLQANGDNVTLKGSRMIARDSRGRIYNEFRPLQPASVQTVAPVMRVHLYDPQTRMYSYLYPRQRTFWVGAVNHPPATETLQPYAAPTGRALPQGQFSHEEDLGTRSMEGIEVHGVRETQTVPAAASGSGKDIFITDEYWYSEELHINIETRHNDPRTGQSLMTVTQLNRSEPDAALFEIPADYQPMQSPGAGDQ